MRLWIRPATLSDVPEVVNLLRADADARNAADPILWALGGTTNERLALSIEGLIAGESSGPSEAPTEVWLVAQYGAKIVGVTRSYRMPQVPPIYTGALGSPGVLYDDCTVGPDAPEGTADALVRATEEALRNIGAQMFIGSSVLNTEWHAALKRNAYSATTLYLTKSNFVATGPRPPVREASAAEVDGIVAASAEHRKRLMQINPFWTTHPDADERFAWWMRKSLTLTDRDMFVAGPNGQVDGYVIAQPIARLLVALAHDIDTVGVIDDFYSRDFADLETPNSSASPAGLLQAAEGAFARRGKRAILAVCPAGWRSKIAALEMGGYRTAKVWAIKA